MARSDDDFSFVPPLESRQEYRLPHGHTYAEWKFLRDRYHERCGYCGAADPLEREHIIPVSRGGTDEITNIAPSCRACNDWKGARTPAEAGMPMPRPRHRYRRPWWH